MKLNKVVISGGGTGGHIFPAIAIANEIKRRYPACEILFIGANGKMEMEKVPAAGYKIEGLDIVGIQRKFTLKNLAVPFKLFKSLRRAKKIIKEFNPDVAIGVGGYASAPTLRVSGKMGIPTLLQEQNSYPGVTNKILAKKAKKICVAYPKMERFFPAEKIIITGNPVRSELAQIEGKRDEALKEFGLSPDKQTIFILGGSLGARTLNNAVKEAALSWKDKNCQVIWQCGKFYEDEMTEFVKQGNHNHLKLNAFIKRMDLAYAAADIVVSRAGALSVSELSLIGKPSIFVPSPNVSEDHQTKNAMALVENEAALLVKDNVAEEQLNAVVTDLLYAPEKLKTLSAKIKSMGLPNATQDIVNEIEKLHTA